MEEDYDSNFDDGVIGDNPEYSPKSEFSKARLSYDADMLCCKLRAKEMRAGYFNTKVSKDGLPIKTWVPDARQEFINSVIALRLLLNPECSRDEKFKEEEGSLNDEENNLINEYSYEEKELDFKKDGLNAIPIFKRTGIKYMPEEDALVILSNKFGKAEEVRGGWNNMRNAYINKKLQIADKRFALLNDLIDRLNYFKQGISFG